MKNIEKDWNGEETVLVQGIIDAYFIEDEEIVLVGFGTLIPRPQTQRLARNPKTGTPVMIPARTTVKFKPGKFLLEAMNAHLK